MDNIDFDETVEFVWAWVARMQLHLGNHGWKYKVNHVLKRGIGVNARKDLADHLFKTIVDAEDPHTVMKALSVQIELLTHSRCKNDLPQEYYTSIENSGTKRVQWDSGKFCHALDEDLEQVMDTFGYCTVLGEKHLRADNQIKKKM